MTLTIRPAVDGDEGIILRFIRELAEYEQLAHEVVGNEAELAGHLFCAQPKVFARIAEWSGEPVGFALYFFNYSTFLCRHGLYIEDVYVVPAMRGKGIGKAMFVDLAREAERQGCGRMEWWVLDWNEPAIRFYESIKAEPMSEWTVQRLDSRAIAELAKTA
ncbi:GNAT family N-acetyltransferase [bacterium]|nr:GNAT family N-acetyltransferase [bacterium]